MKIKEKKIKEKKHTFQLDSGEVALIYEALKIQEKKIREEMFYRPEHPRGFYEMYIDRYNKLLNEFHGGPRVVMKEWKFKQ